MAIEGGVTAAGGVRTIITGWFLRVARNASWLPGPMGRAFLLCVAVSAGAVSASGAPYLVSAAGPTPARTVELARFDAAGLIPIGPSSGEAAHHILPAGFTFQHSHGGTVFIYIVSGMVQISDNAGTKTYGPGNFFYEPPDHVLTAHALTRVDLFALQFLAPGAVATTPVTPPSMSEQRTSLAQFDATHLLPSTAAPGIATITTMSAGVVFKHSHGAAKFIYVVSGTPRITDSSGTRTYHPGDFFIEHAGDAIDLRSMTGFTVFSLTFLPPGAIDTTPMVTAVPTVTRAGARISSTYSVSFSSSLPGQGEVYFGPGSGCSALFEIATQDAGAGTRSHQVTVRGNDLPGTIGDIGLMSGATYSFETVVMSGSGTEIDNNGGRCYTVTVPRE